MSSSRTEYNQECGTGTGTTCEIAGNGIDDLCLTYLTTANPDVCSGTCNTQVSAAVTACEESVSLIVARKMILVTKHL